MGLTAQQAAQYAAQAGFSGEALVTAVAVALAETGGSLNPLAHNTRGEDSRGLWQINVGPGAHPQLANLDLYDPLVNAQQAFNISSAGTNWNAWTTYTGGVYKNYLAQARDAAGLLGTVNVPPIVATLLGTPLGPGPGGTLVAPNPDLPGAVQAAQNAIPNLAAAPIIGGGGGGSIVDAINSFASTLGQVPNALTTPFANSFNDLRSLGAFLGQPAMVKRVLLIIAGGITLFLGLILFAASFIKSQDLANVVRVGT